MRRILTSAAVMALAVAAAGPVQASGPGSRSGGSGPGPSHGSVSGHNNSHSPSYPGKGSYLATHGTKFSNGYFFAGKNHHHWTYQCWSSKYGCCCYYCPYTYCWYYWCEPRCCYYPVSYISVAPPVATAPPAVSQAVTQSVVVNSPGAVLPPTGPDGGPLPTK